MKKIYCSYSRIQKIKNGFLVCCYKAITVTHTRLKHKFLFVCSSFKNTVPSCISGAAVILSLLLLQIALVLLNLSFEKFNVRLLARNESLIRFVFLCVHSSYSSLRQTGLDILGNLSAQVSSLSRVILLFAFSCFDRFSARFQTSSCPPLTSTDHKTAAQLL